MLRVEDLDVSRVRSEATQGAIDDLRWLGLDWDEGPFLQTQRLPIYTEALERLKAEERIYPCTCTRAEIARAASAPHAEDEGPSYPGTCSYRSVADAETLGGSSFAWRFRVPRIPVGWNDIFREAITAEPFLDGGDFVVGRQGQGPSYQLAVVVDDAMMSVNQVIRGADLIPSTPRQILLYQALGWNQPTFGHVPLVIGPDGRRLAKRDGSVKLATLREDGADPHRLIGWLARSLGLTDRVEPTLPKDWVSGFSPGRVPGSACVVGPEDVNDFGSSR